jgi:tetratricopeptide (TPR) repeat protein
VVTTDLAGERLGDFEIIRELGRGGMGVVYEAVQTSLNRRVALKILSPGIGLTPKAVDRFRREAAAAAKLHHTNIVPVYATGEVDGAHFYAMELIDGPSLDAVIRQLRTNSQQPAAAVALDLAATGAYAPPDPLSTPTPSSPSGGPSVDRFDRIAAMIADVAEALHHAHQNGVTHRDIKSSNLMLSPDGRLSVTDFGLAQMLEQPGMTVTGEFVGTPAYMSPEQITAGRVPVDHRTDVYSLGATLYELLTLRPPFTADGRDKLLALVIQKEPPSPRSLDAKVPRDLETICLKCLEKDPDRRYQSGKEMADDLRRFVNRFAILARRAGPLTRARKWAKRNPALSGVGMALVLALALAAFFASQAHEAEQRRTADERKREQEASAEKRRAAIERGMAAALAADLGAADQAVAEAEWLGASTGETRLLRGFIALYTGRSTEARAHLEQAARLMPDSVTGRSLLAYACAASSDWASAERVAAEASALTPRTPEDRLFLGHAIGTLRPAQGLPLMDQALAERPSGIGHVLRANIRVRLAKATGSVTDAEAALLDAELAKRLLPGNPFSLSVASDAHLVAAVAHQKSGQQTKWEEQLVAAGREAKALAKFPGNYWAVQARHDFARVHDGLSPTADMIPELRQTRAASPGALMAFSEAYDLFCLGRDAEAEQVGSDCPNDHLMALIRFLIPLGRRDGQTDARRAWEVIANSGRQTAYQLQIAPLMFAVGKADEVSAFAHELRTGGDSLQVAMFGPEDQATYLAFLEGKSSETDFLARPRSNEHEWCRRHFAIGWKCLGAGDRRGAEAAFRKAYEVLTFEDATWWVARAALIRMKDPDWPRAITAK